MAEIILGKVRGYLGQNLLHNWDFRNPVNQRGVSGAISTGTYFFDRWIRNSGTVTVNAGYLTLASGSVIEQRIEGNLLAGVICTVSFEVGSTIYHGSGVFPTINGTVSVEVDGYPNITFGCATGYMFVLIPATSNTSIQRFKCELGTVSTLHLDPPADLAVELPKCQRFYWKTTATLPVNGFKTAGTPKFSIPLPTTMRIVPTISESSFTGVFIGGVQVSTENRAFTVNNFGGNYIYVETPSAGTSYYATSAYFSSGVEFSADL